MNGLILCTDIGSHPYARPIILNGCMFQVFFFRGELHIIPCPSRPDEVGWSKDEVPTLSQALALLSTDGEVCLASSKIRAVLGKRLER